jgi:dihydrofolate reductase/GNAT superfamily N-acetyltransferase
MKITLIAAMAENRVIGINNTLPWKLSADLRRFKTLTTHHTILMGRKTFESLGRPLSQRVHICISRSFDPHVLTADPRWPEQVFWCGDLFSALELLERSTKTQSTAGTAPSLMSNKETLFVIGGAEIYTLALPLADTLELTHIDAEIKGDAYFPAFENLVTLEEETAGEESGLRYSFCRYHSLRPHGYRTRPAQKSDAAYIANSQCQMAFETEGLVLNPDVVRQGVEAVFDDAAKGTYLIAEQTSQGVQPVGCALLQPEWSDWRNGNIEWLHSVFILPEHRRKGLFQWLYQVVKARARTRGSLGLRLYVDKKNHPAQNVYAKVGMKSEHYSLFEDFF